ncbi:cilia- and flagella-associated protein 53-like isoform X2 [Gouania willdenowi]|uniref:cilia- and flagella-associated protein 53-like isoform X2 n=1 Tax=Gouania willdenowi TaxID=441366 RepID=UPI001055F3F9|nr:cilia- and flagella-associated protein 53-like isoform X2 [Gouania willdenowi]
MERQSHSSALALFESDLQERRQRLKEQLQAEEQNFIQELQKKKEVEKEEEKKKRRERVIELRERREREREQLVTHKLEQLFRQSSEQRDIETTLRQQQGWAELQAQVKQRKEACDWRMKEQRAFEELWESDRRAKEERHRREEEERRERQTQLQHELRLQREERKRQSLDGDETKLQKV